MSSIKQVEAWEVLDSRGNPTVAARVTLSDGASAQAGVPSGASTGTHEACELRDGGTRYGGKGVQRAVRNVTESIAAAVTGMDASDQDGVDLVMREADGTPNLSRLGANAILAVSLATALAAARSQRAPLYELLGQDPVIPLPMVNILSGGAHAGGAVDVQDFLAVPVGADGFAQAIEWVWRVRKATAQLLHDQGHNAVMVADEGGLAAALVSNKAALELLSRGIEKAGLKPGDQMSIAIDVASTQFYEAGVYRLASEQRTLRAAELVEELAQWCDSHPVVSLEDPCAEDDWDGWTVASKRLGRIQLLGDDLFVTQLPRLERGIAEGIANSVLVKVNQNGTVSGAAQVVSLARKAGYAPVVSARSGETEDAWLADLAVGWGAGQIKVGSLTRSERTAKWNRLLRIEAESGAPFAGRGALGGKK